MRNVGAVILRTPVHDLGILVSCRSYNSDSLTNLNDSVRLYLFSMRSFSFLLVPMDGGLQQEYRNESQPEIEERQ